MPRNLRNVLDSLPKMNSGIENKDGYLATKPILKILLFAIFILLFFAILVGVGYGTIYILLLLFPA